MENKIGEIWKMGSLWIVQFSDGLRTYKTKNQAKDVSKSIIAKNMSTKLGEIWKASKNWVVQFPNELRAYPTKAQAKDVSKSIIARNGM